MRTRINLLLLAMTLGGGLCGFAQTDTTGLKVNAPVADYANPKQYVIRDIKVFGAKYQEAALVASIAGIEKGDSVWIPGDYFSQAITKFWNQRLYSDVKVFAEFMGGDSICIEIHLKERPRVFAWNVTGVRKGEKTELIDKLHLRRGTELSAYALDKSIALIKKHFTDKGFLNTTVQPIVKDDTTVTVGSGVSVTFEVTKNKRVKIGTIDFTDNTVFSDKRLRSAFKKTHQKNIKFWQGAKLKDKDYQADKESLIDFYNSKGYRNAHIVSDSVYVINDKRIGIRIDLAEGNKYYFRNIKWVGNSVYQTEYLSAILGIKSGDVYDKRTMGKRLGVGKDASMDDVSVMAEYQNNGYLFSQIDPAEMIIGADSIDLEIKIFEGKQASINEVNISGNMRVNDDVVRRELLVRPGELYNRQLLMTTLRMLNQMGHFNPEALQPDIQPVGNDMIDVGFPLEEQASDKFEISGGWGAGMFVGSVGVQLNNVSLKNFLKKNHWRPYPQGQGQQLTIRAQSNGSYYKSLSLGFVEPWVGGRKPHSLSVSTYYSDETNANYFFNQGSAHFRTVGVSVGTGRRLRWPDPNFTLRMELGYQHYNMKDWTNFLLDNGSANILSISTTFGRNTVDQPIFARSGSEFFISLQLTPPYSLFNDKDYSDPTMTRQERYRWIEYHKWGMKAQWYFPLTRSQQHTLVLMARAEMGYLGAYNKNNPSPFEGYEVGGDGMSGYNVYGVDIIGLRGYDNGVLSPRANYGVYSRAYNKYTVELRFPFIMQPSSTIYGLVFAEGGNAFDSWQSFDPFQLKRSLGVGVRMYLPIVGMLGIDWGYGFDKVPSTGKRSGGHPHFMIGGNF